MQESSTSQSLTEQVISKLPSKARDILMASTLAATSVMTAFDLASHQDLNLRYLFGKVIGNHAGNFAYSAAPMISAMFAREGIRKLGEKLDNQPLMTLANHTPQLAVAVILNLNLFVEHLMTPNNDLSGDVGMGLLAITLSYIAAETVFDRFKKEKLN